MEEFLPWAKKPTTISVKANLQIKKWPPDRCTIIGQKGKMEVTFHQVQPLQDRS